MKVLAISAGMGQPSATRMLVDRLAAATVKHAGAAGLELDEPIEVIELRDIATELMTPRSRAFPVPVWPGPSNQWRPLTRSSW